MEDIDKVFKEYKRKLAIEAIIKTLIIGSILGFAVITIMALLFYFLNLDLLWIILVAGFSVIILCSLILYFTKYRPTTEIVAQRVDELGLYERMITMVELKEDKSFLAQKQREDAKCQISKFNATKLKFVIAQMQIILLCVCAFLATTSTTVMVLSAMGYLPTFDAVVDTLNPYEDYVVVSYEVEDGGFIEGNIYQMLQYGTDASLVIAVADDEYMFDCWSDGVLTPSRKDANVLQSMTVYAQFIKINLDSLPESESDMPSIDDMGDMEGETPDSMGGVAGKYEEYNQIIDGNIYYRDVYEEYYNQAMQILTEGGTVPEYMKEIIERYYGVII